MNITFNVAPALAAIQKATAALDRRNTIPILQNVLLSAETDGTVTVFATNLDMASTATFKADLATAGRVTVPGAMLADVLKNMRGGADAHLSWETGETRAKLVSGRSKFNLPTLPAGDYPAFPPVEPVASLEMGASELAALLSRTAPFASTDQGRLFICGVHIAISNGQLHFVATEGHILCRISRPFPAPDVAVTATAKFVAEAVRVLANEDRATLTLSPGRIGLITATARLEAKTIDMAYVDYNRILTDNRPHAFSLPPEELSAAIRRVSSVGGDVSGLIRMNVAPGLLTLTSRAQDADGADELEIEYDGPETMLRFNAPDTIAALGAVVGEMATIGFADEKSVVAITDSGDHGFLINTAPAK